MCIFKSTERLAVSNRDKRKTSYYCALGVRYSLEYNTTKCCRIIYTHAQCPRESRPKRLHPSGYRSLCDVWWRDSSRTNSHLRRTLLLARLLYMESHERTQHISLTHQRVVHSWGITTWARFTQWQWGPRRRVFRKSNDRGHSTRSSPRRIRRYMLFMFSSDVAVYCNDGHHSRMSHFNTPIPLYSNRKRHDHRQLYTDEKLMISDDLESS